MACPNEPLLGALGGNPYKARNWLLFGQDTKPVTRAVLLLEPRSGGRVGFAMGQDDAHFCVLSDNQSETVTITCITKIRLGGARWRTTFPARLLHPPPLKLGEFLAPTNDI